MRRMILILFAFTMTASITSHIFQQKWHFYRKAEALFFREHYEEALFSYLQSLRWGLDEELISTHFIHTLSKLGGGTERIDPFLARIKKEGQKAHLLTKVALIFLLENKAEESEKILKTPVVKKLKSSFVHLLLARSLFLQRKGKEAIAEYQKALNKDFQNDPLRYEFAKVLAIEKQYEEAYFHYQKLYEKKKSPSLSLEIANLLLLQQKTGAALDMLENLDEQEIDANTELFLGRMYAKENQTEKAAHALLLYLGKKPNDFTVRFELAELSLLHKNYALATEQYQKIIEENPHDRYIRRALALSLLRDMRTEETKKELARSLAEESQKTQVPQSKRISDFQARHILARLLHLQEGHLEKSLSHYLLLAKEEPKDIRIHMEMGEIYQKLKLYEKALDEFKIASSLDPKNVRAQINEGKIYLFLNDEERALSLFKKMPKTSPLVQKFLIETARCFKQEKKLSESLWIYKELAEKNEDPRLFEETGDLFTETNQIKSALLYYQQALKMSPGSETLKEKIREALQKTQQETPFANS